MLLVDFRNDWKEYLTEKFRELGSLYDDEKSLVENTLTYFNAIRRILPSKKRTVNESSQLSIPAEYTAVYGKIKNIIRNGDDLKPYLSTGTKSLTNNDLLLNEWGIHHLHLGNSLRNDGYIERTGALLYVMFTDDAAYMLQVLNHGAWTNIELIQIIHDNWPDLLSNCKTTIPPEHVTSENRKALRKKHYNVTITVADGTTYLSPAGGITSAGNCSFDTINADRTLANFVEWQGLVIENRDKFYKAMELTESDEATIKLIFEEDGCWLLEPNRNIRFNLITNRLTREIL
jgi:hypothetical protein